MLSVNRLGNRKSDFKVNEWMLDSGAFTELARFGHYRHSVQEYAECIIRCNPGRLATYIHAYERTAYSATGKWEDTVTPTDQSSYRPSSFRSLLIAVLVLTATLLALSQLSDIVKLLGAPLLYLPAQLGLLQQVTWADVSSINPAASAPPPRLLNLPRVGRYAVYTDDEQLLAGTNWLQDHHQLPELVVKAVERDTRVAVAFVERGVRPYDTPLAKGRPIFTFVVVHPGQYYMFLPRDVATMTVTPDYTTGKETTFLVVMLLQLGVVGAIVAVIIYIRTERMRMRQQQQAAIDAQRREQGEAFWQSEIQRNKGAGERPE
jgi:hypothetical protein